MNVKELYYEKITPWFQKHSSMFIMFTAVLLLGISLAVLYYHSHESLRREAKERAENHLTETGLKIRNVMSAIEIVARNMTWSVQKYMDKPETLYHLLGRIVSENKNIVGAGVGFKANYFPNKGRWFEPYITQNSDGTLKNRQIGGAHHNYFEAEWFKNTMECDSCLWSEPYYDESGAKTLVATFSSPIHDTDGNIVGVLATDISLDWLSKVINDDDDEYPSENIMVSRKGHIMACPVESLIMNLSSLEAAAQLNDTMAMEVDRRMLAGESGETTVWNNKGEKTYVFYAPVDESTGWSMAVICKDKDIYGNLQKISMRLIAFMMLGLFMLGFILWLSARQAARLQKSNAEKQRIGSELRIARSIQEQMVPKDYPPYPERDDIDIIGTIKPAKEVGGDLFDFYIRDEKLFFCIGDVSGKGIPASLVMAVTRFLFRTISTHEPNATRIMEMMNESLSSTNKSSMFITFFIGILDLPTGRLRYCNAGHNAPLIISSANDNNDGHKAQTLDVIPNIPLGIMGDFKFEGQETVMNPQTSIFLYTDGLTEAEDTEHKLFGEERMINVANESPTTCDMHSENLLGNMQKAIGSFVGEAEQSDDITMLLIKYTKEHREVKLKRTITLTNDVGNVPQLNAFVDTVAEELALEQADTMELNLALEEAVVNVMNYAYPHNTQGDINITAEANDIRLKFTITDHGMPFDPTMKEDADTTLSAEERPIGGLGIYLVRQLMDSINYERTDGCNVLTLRKKLVR